MKKIITILFIVFLLPVLSAGCGPGLQAENAEGNPPPENSGAGGQAGPAMPSAWIDAPRDGMELPLEAYEIIYHASDPAGVSRVELTANDVLLSEQGSTGPGQLLTLRYDWTPPAAGDYILRAREQNASGTWSDPSVVHVSITGATITPTLTLTPTATATETPTATPTLPLGLALINPTRSSTSFMYGRCEPGSITFSIQATVPGDVQYMYLFYKLQDKDTGEFTPSNGGTSMTKSGHDTWVITLKGTQVQNYDRFDESWFIYQFVSQGPNQVMTRSVQINDVTLAACGITVPEETAIPTPFILNPWE